MPKYTHSVFEVCVQPYSYLVHKIEEIISSKLRPHYRRGSTGSFTLDTMLSHVSVWTQNEKNIWNFLGYETSSLGWTVRFVVIISAHGEVTIEQADRYLPIGISSGVPGGLGVQSPTPPPEIPKFCQSWNEFPSPWNIHPSNLIWIRVLLIWILSGTPD
jgi:hypothetical protein